METCHSRGTQYKYEPENEQNRASLISQWMFIEHAKHYFEGAFVEKIWSVWCWRHSAHTVLNGRKGFVVSSAVRRLWWQWWGIELDIYVQLSTISTHPCVCVLVCLFVLLCCYWRCSFTSRRLRHVWFRWSDRCWGENHQQQTQDQQQCGKSLAAASSFCLCFKAFSTTRKLRAELSKQEK